MSEADGSVVESLPSPSLQRWVTVVVDSEQDAQQRQQMGAAGIHFAARFDWQRSADILKRYL